MKIKLTIEQTDYSADLSRPQSIAITLRPNGEQPSHFGAPAASSKPVEVGSFIGDTRRGGSCNASQLTLVPHCNGTHTESIAHITDQKFAVYRAIRQPMFPAVLISVTPKLASETNDSYRAGFDPDNRVIDRAQLESLLARYRDQQLVGLVIRSLPNQPSKKSCVYSSDNYPIYLTNEAMTYLSERTVNHLLVDFPSVDKMYDQGQLSNHRIFWNVAMEQTSQSAVAHFDKTITEMIFIDDKIEDGFYLCDLQIPQIETDAVPSRPLLFKLARD